jgi:hypothetical protein
MADAAFTRRVPAVLAGSFAGFTVRAAPVLGGSGRAATRRAPGRRDLYSGPCRISGTVAVLTEPASRPVVLLPQDDLKAVRATRSAADGSYSFDKIAAGTWVVLGIDYTAAYRAVAVDRITTTAP